MSQPELITTPEKIKLNGYTLGKTLGVGTFGKVKSNREKKEFIFMKRIKKFKNPKIIVAVHDLTGISVAIKILNKKQIKNLQMEKKIKREIEILQILRHPHIIKLYVAINN